ncbi:hypothetical protein V6N13_124466 [Hibiscus sabdariffa]
MDLTDAIHISVAIATPTESEQLEPSARAVTEEAEPTHSPAPATAQSSHAATPEAQCSFPATPASSPSTAEQQPPPAQTSDIQLLQLRSQLQRMEARQLKFIEETKVFQNTLLNFLQYQFPSATALFPHQEAHNPPADTSATDLSAEAGQTEPIHFSSNVVNDAFDWNTPYEHRPRHQPHHLLRTVRVSPKTNHEMIVIILIVYQSY